MHLGGDEERRTSVGENGRVPRCRRLLGSLKLELLWFLVQWHITHSALKMKTSSPSPEDACWYTSMCGCVLVRIDW